MKVSVIATVKNEEKSIAPFLDSLLAQTRKPEEVVIVDGGSSDGTVQILRSYENRLPLKILLHPGSNISQGRNAAIASASGEIIASTDGGVRVDEKWLEYLVLPFQENQDTDVTGGFFLPDPHSAFEVALAATTLPALADIGRGAWLPSWVRRILLFIDLDKFLPSSRSVAFRRSSWAKVGGYPEWVDYSEDLVFDLALKAAGFRFRFEPRALVYFTPRPNLNAFFRQYFHYARGDGQARLWGGEHILRYLTYFLFAPLLLTSVLFRHPIWWLAFIAALALYLLGPYRRLWPMIAGRTPREKILTFLWVPIIRPSGDIAKMLGYPLGLCWRLAHGKEIDRARVPK